MLDGKEQRGVWATWSRVGRRVRPVEAARAAKGFRLGANENMETLFSILFGFYSNGFDLNSNDFYTDSKLKQSSLQK
jgi:hypothetical protein